MSLTFNSDAWIDECLARGQQSVNDWTLAEVDNDGNPVEYPGEVVLYGEMELEDLDDYAYAMQAAALTGMGFS